jgi:hypothetical protein
MSYTQYLCRDGKFVATPNGIAVEMLHSLRGNRLESLVSQLDCRDSRYCAIAVENEGEYAVLCTNPTPESMPCFIELTGLEDGEYTAEIYSCNLLSNNIVYKNGKGTGKLEKTGEMTVTAQNGILQTMELYDKDCFSLTRIRKI